MLKKSHFFIISLFLFTNGASTWGEIRTFTNDQGQSLQAEIIGFDPEIDKGAVELQTPDGRKIKAGIQFFSEEDQAFIKKWYKQEKKKKEMLHSKVELDIRLKLNKKSDSDSRYGTVRDATETFFPELNITNKELAQSFSGNKVHIVVVAEDLRYESNFLIVSTSSKKVDFPKKETVTIEGESFRLRNYKWSGGYSYKYGYKYKGYVVVVKNAKGQITHTEASPKKFATNISKVLKCKTGEIYDETLTKKSNQKPNSYYFIQ